MKIFRKILIILSTFTLPLIMLLPAVSYSQVSPDRFQEQQDRGIQNPAGPQGGLFSNPNPAGTPDLSNPDGSDPVGPCGGRLCNPLAFGTIPELISAILDIIVQIGIPIAIFFFVFAGFKYVTARGDTTAISTAHNMFLYTAIGAFILIGARLLSAVLEGTINQLR